MFDLRIQEGKNTPKWEHRTRMGQYLVKSPKYVRSVGLVRNLHKGYISPQFYIIYNNNFHTVVGGEEDSEAIVSHI